MSRSYPEPGNCLRCWGMGTLKWELRRGAGGETLWIAIPSRDGQTCPVCAGTGKRPQAQMDLPWEAKHA